MSERHRHVAAGLAARLDRRKVGLARGGAPRNSGKDATSVIPFPPAGVAAAGAAERQAGAAGER